MKGWLLTDLIARVTGQTVVLPKGTETGKHWNHDTKAYDRQVLEADTPLQLFIDYRGLQELAVKALRNKEPPGEGWADRVRGAEGTPMKTFWLSFVDEDRPEGDRFLGVAIVQVTEADVAAVLPQLNAQFPHRLPDSEWIAAATRKAHRLGCNPGGQVMSLELHAGEVPPAIWLNRLLTRAEADAVPGPGEDH
jgi:hypothetical protein